MTLEGKNFWPRKQGKDFIDEAKLRAKRYFDACEQIGLLARWRRQYAIYHMRDPYSTHGNRLDSSVLSLGTKLKPNIAIQIPEVRSLLRQQLAFLLADNLEFQCVASIGSQRNVMSSEVGEKALNYVYDEHIRPSMPEFAELATVYGMAATHLRWNSEGGDDVTKTEPILGPDQQPMINVNDGTPLVHKMQVKSGAPYIDVCNSTMFAMDPVIGTKANWIIGFERTNLYVLAGQYAANDPQLADQILSQSTADDFQAYRLSPGMWTQVYGADEGDIVIMHVYYADSPEFKGGRYAMCVGDLVLTDPKEKCPLQAGRLPIRPMVTAKFTDNAMSFADSFGLGPIEEALNRTRSSELNNYAYYGKQTRWREDSVRVIPGDDANSRELVGPRGSQPPKMLEIQSMPPGAETLKKDLLESLPRISGYADVSRGLNVEKTTSGVHLQGFEAITARNLSLPAGTFAKHQQAVANDMLSMLQNFGNTAFIAEIAGPDGQALAREFSPQDLSTLRRLVGKAIPESMRGPAARLQLVDATKEIEDPRERGKAVQMILRGDDEYGRNDSRALNLIAIENERLISGSEVVTAAISQNHMAHMPDHQAALDYVMSQENPDGTAVTRLTAHLTQHSELLQNADPVMCKALGYPDPPILPGNAAFAFAQRMAQAQMMLNPQETPDPITGMVPNNPAPNNEQAQAQVQATAKG